MRSRTTGIITNFYNTGCKWTEANAACKALGGHIVTITSQREQEFCVSLIGGLCPKYCWIGAYRNSSGWHWVTDERWEYTNWSKNQPNGSGGGNYALIQNYQGIAIPYTWDDQGDSGDSPSAYWSGSPYYETTDYYSYICEWDESDTYTGEGLKPLTVPTSTMDQTIKTSKSEEIKGSSYPLLQARAINVKTTSFKLKWNSIPSATKYLVYGNRCGKKNKYEYITETTKTFYKAKKLKKKTFYKYVVMAVKDDKVITVSKTVHVGMKPKQNPTKVKVNKTKITLQSSGGGSTFQIKAKIKGTKLKQHRGPRYETDNVNVATVDKYGKITAIGKGACNIYCYTQNGVCAKISVTVM